LSKEKQDEIGMFRIQVEAEQGKWLEEHFPTGVRSDRKSRVASVATVNSMKDIGINEHQSSQSRLINKEPDLVQEAIEEIKKDNKQVVTPNAVQKIVRKKVNEKKINDRIFELKNIEEKIKNNEIKKIETLFNVITIDPPWAYEEKGGLSSEQYNPDTTRGATPYPTMNLENIKKIKLPAADDCVLFLWTTHSFLREAFNLLEIWGFNYKATIVWDKEIMGLGRNIRMQCEFCLLATKGKPYLNGSAERDIIREKRREHSRKPEAFYQMVERMTIGIKLDYFSRESRKNWFHYGAEIGKF